MVRAPLLLAAISGAACGDGSDGGVGATPDPHEGESFEVRVTAAEGGTLTTPGGTATAEVPPGALTEDLALTVTVGPREAETAGSVYTFGPEGTAFALPVLLSVACDLEVADDERIVLGYEGDEGWEPIPGSLFAEDRVDGATRHFSRFSALRVPVQDLVVAFPGNGDESTMTYRPWTDPGSGLTWQYPTAVKWKTWEEAVSYCDGLYLDGTGWRLPSIDELRSLVRGCPSSEPGGACGITDDCLEQFTCWGDDGDETCNGCGDGGCLWAPELFYVGEPDCALGYLSSSPYQVTDPYTGEPDDDADRFVWGLNFGYAGVFPMPKMDRSKVRCVRGGG